MTTRSLRLSCLLALLVVPACDGGADARATPKQSVSTKADPAKSGASKAGPTRTETETPAVAKADPMPAEAKTPTLAEADPPTEPTPTEPTPTEPAEADTPPETPAEADEPAEPDDDPTELAEADEPDEPAEPTPPAVAGSVVTATGPEIATPISLGPDAELLRLVLCHDMENRQPVEPSTSFPEGHKVQLFIESRNEGEEPTGVRVTWENTATGQRSPPTWVKIGRRKIFRTRAYRTMRKGGSYKAVVLGEGDVELAILPFTVQ